MKTFTAYTIITVVAFVAIFSHALECPKFPEQAKKDWEVNVTAEVAKIGPLKGAELKTTTRNVTKDLLGKLPDADRVYLEQMMFATYCTALRDDKSLTDTEKSKRLNDYIREVRKVTRTKNITRPKGKPATSKIELRNQYPKSPSTNPVGGNDVQVINNAPQGFAISGGNVTNPTINNSAPPRRRIPTELRPELIAILAKKPMKVEVETFINDAEAYQFAQDWYDILKEAGWEMQSTSVRLNMMGGGPPPEGIVVYMKGEPIKPGQYIALDENDQSFALAKCMGELHLRPIAVRSMDRKEGFIDILVGPRP
jgi:hypothetical protein